MASRQQNTPSNTFKVDLLPIGSGLAPADQVFQTDPPPLYGAIKRILPPQRELPQPEGVWPEDLEQTAISDERDLNPASRTSCRA
jgi:hypothetical protein